MIDGGKRSPLRRRRRSFVLPPYYDAQLQKRMDERGVTRTAALLGIVDEATSRSPSAVDDLREASRAILAAAMALRRLIRAEGAAGGLLDSIERQAVRVSRTAGGT